MKYLQYDPKPAPENVIIHGQARFTLLTDRMVRMEWQQDGGFEDRESLAVVNRRMPGVDHSAKVVCSAVTIETKSLHVVYTDNGRPFSARNLSISFKINGQTVQWKPGKKDPKNLKGTLRTLDGMNADKRVYGWHSLAPGEEPRSESIGLPDGLISRNGWAIYDDSKSVVIESSGNDGEWIKARPRGERRDLYFLGYGRDYKTCLSDAARIFGKQVLPPKYAFGYWYCRYWAYTDVEVREIVEQFDTMGIPLDVFIIDMDWHLPGWTGYTWDRRFFPAPEKLISWLHDRGLKVSLNLHPADGVAPKEEAYALVCRDVGIDPKQGKTIQFDCSDPSYIDAYFKHLHHPKEDIGIDFWWIDWQQGEITKVPGLDPLPWLNRLHWEDQKKRRPNRRPLNFSRYGGLGSGRHPVGFSGDTFITWESLKYQLYFTPTASNVLYGYWSHDLGGHMGPGFAPEMYVRWMQFGAYSPIMRTHSSKQLSGDRRPWEYPDPYKYLIADAIRLRYELVPYVYSEMKRCLDTGISLLKPMYYEYPDDDRAYTAKFQYFFGDHMLVSPIAEPSHPDTEMVKHKTWLPEGPWIDVALGKQVTGDLWYQESYLISETPVFVRPGTVIPGQFDAYRLTEGGIKNLLITAYPGGNGEYTLYEDDGATNSYLRGQSAYTKITNECTGKTQRIRIHPIEGAYRGQLKKRSVCIRIPLSAPPVQVIVNDEHLEWSDDGKPRTWTYNGLHEEVVVWLGERATGEITEIVIIHNTKLEKGRIPGFRGLAARLKRICTLNGMVVPISRISDNERIGVDVGQAYNRITIDPARYSMEMDRLRELLPALSGELGKLVEPLSQRRAVEESKLAAKARDMAKAVARQYGQGNRKGV